MLKSFYLALSLNFQNYEQNQSLRLPFIAVWPCFVKCQNSKSMTLTETQNVSFDHRVYLPQNMILTHYIGSELRLGNDESKVYNEAIYTLLLWAFIVGILGLGIYTF